MTDDLSAIKNVEFAQNKSERARLIERVRLALGEEIVDVELDPKHYNSAVDKAFDKYRQLSSNSVEESYILVEAQPGQSSYRLPDEVEEVRQIFRRGTTGAAASGGGAGIDPFAYAFTNLYLLQSGGQGGLLTFDLYHQYQDVLGRMFGRDINFKYDQPNHTLYLIREIRSVETLLLWVYMFRPDAILLRDRYAQYWIYKWALAEAKMILGTSYAKYQQIIGPGGGALPADALKSEAKEEMMELKEEIKLYQTGEEPLGFVVG